MYEPLTIYGAATAQKTQTGKEMKPYETRNEHQYSDSNRINKAHNANEYTQMTQFSLSLPLITSLHRSSVLSIDC